ncbi:MAG: glutaredoxin family protein [Thermoanaerobaculia bacterium]|nr:glutaredoxin family protein [Thermoanaerobaculia bacterium]
MKPSEPSADPNELVVYGAKDCSLCDKAMEVLRKLTPELGLKLRYVSIDGDAALESAYRQQIPVGFLGGRKLFKFHVDPERLRRAAARAPRRR